MKFGDAVTIINGRNQKQVENAEGIYPIYGSGGIIGWATDYICEPHTVVIGRKGTINRPIYVETPFWNVDTAFGLAADTTKLLPKYLYYFCCYFDFEALNTTVTIPSLTKANLQKIEIELPSLEKQREVVEILDQITSLIELREQQIVKLDELVKARFVELFGDINTNDKGWESQPLGDLCTIVRGGSPRPIENYLGGDVPWIKIGDATKGDNIYLHSTKEYIIQDGVKKSRMVKSGSLRDSVPQKLF